MSTLNETDIRGGVKEIEVDELFQYLPFVPIPGGALSYDEPINALSEYPLNLNQSTLGVKRGIHR